MFASLQQKFVEGGKLAACTGYLVIDLYLPIFARDKPTFTWIHMYFFTCFLAYIGTTTDALV